MELVLLMIHLFLAIALVGVVLLQKSEGGALGSLGGGGGGMGGFLTARGAANLLTRTTAILATAFICTSLALAFVASQKRATAPASIVDQPGRSAPPATAPAPATPSAPEKK
jgi:preprotein translocase subunit SecG